MSDIHVRRALLITRRNPNPAHDYLCDLSTRLDRYEISIRYVPDKDLAQLEDLTAYFDAVFTHPDTSPEAFASLLLDDFNNELIPRWIQITLSLNSSDPMTHRVILEDRQPNWDNAYLIQRLKPI